MENHISNNTISFDTHKVGSWLDNICREQGNIIRGKYRNERIHVVINSNSDLSHFSPVHFVTLACLVMMLKKEGCLSEELTASHGLEELLVKELHFDEYFQKEVAHIESKSGYNLNLWKVELPHVLAYSQHVASYLKRKYFQAKDLSGLKVILDELYANIADHADAKGIAYSFINYKEEEQMLYVAFCDFGIGIENSLKKGRQKIDGKYIETATLKGISARSNTHNRGFGLDTVTSCICEYGGTIRILSGRELYICSEKRERQKTFKTPFDFKGTLIYFNIPVSSFESEDYIDDFEF